MEWKTRERRVLYVCWIELILTSKQWLSKLGVLRIMKGFWPRSMPGIANHQPPKHKWRMRWSCASGAQVIVESGVGNGGSTRAACAWAKAVPGRQELLSVTSFSTKKKLPRSPSILGNLRHLVTFLVGNSDLQKDLQRKNLQPGCKSSIIFFRGPVPFFPDVMFKACFSLGESTSRLCGTKLGSGVPWGAGNDLWQHEKTVGFFFLKLWVN